MTTPDLDSSTVKSAYARWAPIYDAVCGPVMVKGRRAAASAARAVGGRILEVGVGTGLSFDDYDASTEITGIDLSAPMLAKAREKMASGRYPHVRDVQLMDAHSMTFASATFDCVTTLSQTDDETFNKLWIVKRGEQLIMTSPKKVAIRGWAFSHQFHHRGQLSVYLRLLDIPVPGMYGPSADER